MRVFQLLPTMSFGDAIGNDAIALGRAIREMRLETGIFAENIDIRLPANTAYPLDTLPRLRKNDVILYHKSTGTRLSFGLDGYRCRKVMVYHNITPPDFFRRYSPDSERLCQYGLSGARYLADKIDYCLAVSAFNRQNLIDMGYRCPIDVLPILIPFSDYEKEPDKKTIKRFSDGWVNLVFVGRVAPNKKQEDVIRAFCFYKKHFNPKSRLILVGSYSGMERYYFRLWDYAHSLGLTENDVYFTGHIRFSEILAYYRLANVFLCMSEHEGFCVPLVESMYFKVPIVAYASSAIPETLSGSGILLQEKDPVLAAAAIDRLVRDPGFRDAVVAAQSRRLQDFSYEKISATFKKQLGDFIGSAS